MTYPKMSEMFPSRFLKAGDLPPGREVPLQIDGITLEEIQGEDEARPCLSFRGQTKLLVLNRTNANTLAERFGDDSGSWIGKTVAAFATSCQFGGRTVPCLRLRVPLPPAAPAAPAVSDTVPFDVPAVNGLLNDAAEVDGLGSRF